MDTPSSPPFLLHPRKTHIRQDNLFFLLIPLTQKVGFLHACIVTLSLSFFFFHLPTNNLILLLVYFVFLKQNPFQVSNILSLIFCRICYWVFCFSVFSPFVSLSFFWVSAVVFEYIQPNVIKAHLKKKRKRKKNTIYINFSFFVCLVQYSGKIQAFFIFQWQKRGFHGHDKCMALVTILVPDTLYIIKI